MYLTFEYCVQRLLRMIIMLQGVPKINLQLFASIWARLINRKKTDGECCRVKVCESHPGKWLASSVSQRHRKWLQQLSRFPRRLMQQNRKKKKTQLCRVNYSEAFGPHFKAKQGTSRQGATWMVAERILLITGPYYRRLRPDHDHRHTWCHLFFLLFIFLARRVSNTLKRDQSGKNAPGFRACRPHESSL